MQHRTNYLRLMTFVQAVEIYAPKRQEGDGQVPEGFYTIDLFNQVLN